MGVILAGGEGRRLGGEGKAFLTIAGRHMIDWTGERLIPQVSDVLTSIREETPAWERLDYATVDDAESGFSNIKGALVGLAAAMSRTIWDARTDWVLTVPVDAVIFPLDTHRILSDAIEATKAPAAFLQPAPGREPTHIALLSETLFSSLRERLARGECTYLEWLQDIKATPVSLSANRQIMNLDTPSALEEFSTRSIIDRPEPN